MEKYEKIVEETYYEIWETFNMMSTDDWIEKNIKKILKELIETVEKGA